MTRIADFFGVPQPPRHPQREWMIENQGIAFEEDPTINQVQQNQRNTPQANVVNQRVGIEPPRVEPLGPEPPIPRERQPRVVMVNRNQDADEVIHQIRHDDMVEDNNLAAMVKRIMARNGVNVGPHRPNYTSLLSEYILQSELLPR